MALWRANTYKGGREGPGCSPRTTPTLAGWCSCGYQGTGAPVGSFCHWDVTREKVVGGKGAEWGNKEEINREVAERKGWDYESDLGFTKNWESDLGVRLWERMALWRWLSQAFFSISFKRRDSRNPILISSSENPLIERGTARETWK
jgi:hypothetical protein